VEIKKIRLRRNIGIEDINQDMPSARLETIFSLEIEIKFRKRYTLVTAQLKGK
jgi:hypothetical protein